MYDDLIWPFQQNTYHLLVVSVGTHTNLTLLLSTLLTLLKPIITAEPRRELVPACKAATPVLERVWLDQPKRS